LEDTTMTTLVSGATGRLGSRFVPRLLAEGERVRVVVRNAAAADELQARGAEIVLGDLRDASVAREAVEGAAAVVHLAAAFRGVPDEEARAVNHAATVDLARAAVAAGVSRFVFASTNLVYGPGRGRPARESDEPGPSGAYPESKVAAEEALRALHGDEALGLRVVRLAFVYGEGDPHLGESLMWAGRWPAHQRLHLVHHADVGQALIRALRSPGIDGMTFNAADDAPVTAAELHDLNGEALTEDAATRPLDDPWMGIVDTTAARTMLGFRPIFPTVYTAKAAGAL
jgi:nucleoside-diphosphate-sugar epimerase